MSEPTYAGWNVAVALTASALALAGCGLVAANKETEGIARAVYAEIAQNADLSKDARVSPVFLAIDSQAALAAIRAIVPPTPPTSSASTGWHFWTSSGVGSSAQMSYTYKYPGRAVDVVFVMQKGPGQATWTVVGFEAEQEGATAAPIVVGVPPKSAAELD